MSAGSGSGITFSGLSSGIDVNSIVTQLVNLERIPVQRLQRQRSSLEADSLVFTDFRSRLTSFKSSLNSLNQASNFNPMSSASSSTSVATISTGSSAIQGVYQLTVRKLAQAHKLSSTAQVDTVSALNQTGVFKVNGKEVTVESSDSLTSIAQKINGLEAKVTASVINGGTNRAYLSLTANDSGASNAIQLENVSGGALASLGSFGTELVGAQDAEFELDGLTMTSDKNTVTGVIPDATITLLKANVDGSEKSTLSISRDSNALKQKMREFRDAYNGVVNYIRDNSRFDAETFRSGPLFGDSTAASVEAALNATAFSDVGQSTIRNLASLGFTVEESGALKFDEAEFDRVVSTNPGAAQNVFVANGSGSVGTLKYVSSGNKTKAGTYDVAITQAATRTVGTGSMAQTQVSGGGETITFGGPLFGNGSILLTTAGGTAADLVSQINGDSRLRDLVVASLDQDGKLALTSKSYGASSGFTVTSNQDASDSNSGIGTGGAVVVTGLDVQGTVNGEAATGNGQFLMGAVGNDRTEGLQIMYTGDTTGNIGQINFNQGLSNMLDGAMEPFTDVVNGVLAAADKAVQSQIEDINSRISRMNESLVLRESFLRQRFARMEEAMGRLQSQGGQISSMAAGWQANNRR